MSDKRNKAGYSQIIRYLEGCSIARVTCHSSCSLRIKFAELQVHAVYSLCHI